jgi:hypothetical protein
MATRKITLAVTVAVLSFVAGAYSVGRIGGWLKSGFEATAPEATAQARDPAGRLRQWGECRGARASCRQRRAQRQAARLGEGRGGRRTCFPGRAESPFQNFIKGYKAFAA